jgi:hypothetical protein
MNTLPPAIHQTRGTCTLLILKCQRIKKFIGSAVVALAAVLLTAQPCRSQNYTVGDLGDWSGLGYTGFEVDAGGGDVTVGQTFQINNGDALVSSISFPIYNNNSSSIEFQAGVAAWNGTQATGSLLYLSGALSATGGVWQSFSVPATGLTLNQGQEYVLFLTANSYFNTEPPFTTEVGYVPSGDYTDGQYYSLPGYQLTVNDLFTQSWTASQVDLAFDIDYQVVPEPGTFALLCSGSLALWLRSRIFTRVKSLSRFDHISF